MPTSPRLRVSVCAAVATASAASLAPSLSSPALAAGLPTAARQSAVPGTGSDDGKQPSRRSEVGGRQLGLSGVQVDPKKGADAPSLPEGITSRAWIVADASTGEVLASRNAHRRLAPASTLKMLFADILLPKIAKTTEHKVEPEDLEGMGDGSSLVGVKEGQTYRVEDLWRGVFLRSGNDAVHVLAAMNGGVEKTVAEMNEHAKKLNAEDTHVVSPDGYDKPGQVSSAYDLTLFARSGLQKPDFREYASTVDAQFPGLWKKGKDGKKKREHFGIQNTNRLLTGDYDLDPYPGIAGVKNGMTTNAGSTFTGLAKRNGRELLVTAMHPSTDNGLAVYRETAKLFDWGFEAAGKVAPVGRLAEAGEPGSTANGGPAHSAAHSAGGDHHGRRSEEPSGGGVGLAIGVTGGVLVLLAVAGYAVHRRWPLSDLSRLKRRLPR